MSKRKKIAIWVMGVIGALLVLLLILLLLLPTFINLEPIKEKIVANLSQKIGGELKFQRVDLSFFPRPRVMIHQGSVSIPGKVAGTLESLTIYPKILPLLRGRVRMGMVHVQTPDLNMDLPEKLEGKKEEPTAFSFVTIEENVGPVLGFMSLKAPGLIVVVERGRLNLSEENKPVFWFRDIHGRISLPPDKLEIDLSCDSNLWESMSLEGWLDPESFKGIGRIDVTHFQPQRLTDHFFPFATRRVGDSSANLTISLNTDGFKALQAEVQGSLPSLTLQRAHEKVVIRGKTLKGALHMEGDRITISLAELDLDHPQLRISGTFLIDQTTPRVSLELEGREIDVNSMRQAALAVGGDIPSAQEILGMVKGGKIPLITVSAQGSSLADLEKVENIHVKGSIVEGKAFLPGVNVGLEGINLDVGGIKGEMIISKGILKGRDLEARWKNIQVRDGILRLGLKGKDVPFHLDTVVEGELAQLHAIIGDLIRNQAFQEELILLKEIRGKAVGRVFLDGTTSSVKARVDISECNLFARYGRIPYPLEIQRGKISYDGNTISGENLNGSLGKSLFSELTATLSFKKAPHLAVLSGKSSISLDEIYPWLSSLEGLSGALKDLKSVQGTIALSGIDVKGPLSDPEKWRFRMKGDLKKVVLKSNLFPGPVTVPQGGFEIIPEKVSLGDIRLNIVDSSLRLSGSLDGYLEGLHKADVKGQGNVGPKTIQWMARQFEIPPKLKIRAPFSISGAHAVWDKKGGSSFSAKLVVKDGPRVSIDVLQNPEELTVENFTIRDSKSNASFALQLKEREFHLTFKGNLGKTTLDGLLVKNEILTGRVDGDFEAHILMDYPMRSKVQGKLRGIGLGHQLELKVPLTIENFSLEAKKNKLKVESALLTWRESHLNLEGDVEFSEKAFRFDMNLSADGLEWERVEELLEGEDQEGDLQRQEDLRVPPLEGILRVRLEFLKYGGFTWRPLHAAISFDHDKVKLAVTEANVCGISTPGIVKATPQGLSLDFKPVSRSQELRPTFDCLFSKQLDMTGNFDFKGKIMAQGNNEELARSLRGNFEFIARDGRIYRLKLLSTIFGLVNVTEIFVGKFPDLGRQGFAYDAITVKGNLQEGKLNVEEMILDGSSMEIVGQGDIDLIAQKMDFTVLVAPLKTVDFAVKKIPLVRSILGGTLLSIPVRVRGDLRNPTVSPLSPSAVGSELKGIMGRTFRLPIKVVEPLRPGKGKK